MRAGVVVVLVAACGFRIEGGSGEPPGDGPAGDGPPDLDAPDAPVIDGAIDAPMVSACTVAPTGAVAAIAGIGGNGGNQQGSLVCPAGELPIGLAFDVTPAPVVTHANQLLMVNVRVRCGAVARTTANQMTSTPSGASSHPGLNGSGGTGCATYQPVVPSSEVRCSPGQVLVGITGNRADTTLYNTVGIRCATLNTNGTVTTTTTNAAIGGTGSYSNAPQTSACAEGSAIISFVARSGCGQDSLTPSCSALTCQ